MLTGRRNLASITFVAPLAITTAALAETPVKATKTEAGAFIQADKDQSATLNQQEFKAFVNILANGGQPTAKTIRLFNAYGYAFGRADTNRDGIVTPLELRSANDTFEKNGN